MKACSLAACLLLHVPCSNIKCSPIHSRRTARPVWHMNTEFPHKQCTALQHVAQHLRHADSLTLTTHTCCTAASIAGRARHRAAEQAWCHLRHKVSSAAAIGSQRLSAELQSAVLEPHAVEVGVLEQVAGAGALRAGRYALGDELREVLV